MKISIIIIALLYCFSINNSMPTTKTQGFFLSLKAPERFTLGYNDFLLEGQPLQMISGEMAYPRIPREAWRDRIKMAKAMGLNSIGTYVFWNVHEPQKGQYDFTGNNDVAAFIKIIQEEGMWVVLRPSPYVCAEWEFGGYPYWLQNEKDLQVRSKDPNYLAIYKKYINEVGKQLSPFLVNKGGNVLMVQVENEYGSYGNDKEYLEINRQIFIEAGFNEVLFTCDPKNAIVDGHLPGILPAINGVEIPFEVKQLISENNGGKGPYYIAEWYPAWYDWWGTKHHTIPALVPAVALDAILKAGISINMYMFHGGSTRDFMNGANFDDDFPHYRPQISSYDYDAPLDEAGNATYKFQVFRDVIQKNLKPGQVLPPVPNNKKSSALTGIKFNSFSNIYDIIKNNNIKKVDSDKPLTFEQLNQAYGFVLYRTIIQDCTGGEIEIINLRDYGVVLVNEQQVGILDRMKDENKIKLPSFSTPQNVVLDILVENLGRINFGKGMLDNFKGITEKVLLNGSELLHWSMYGLPFDKIHNFTKLNKTNKSNEVILNSKVPLLKIGSFDVTDSIDTYLNFSNWGKGVVWVNGHNLGRYWNIGPQQTIYLPAEWIKKGSNEIIVFELIETEQNVLEGVKESILDVLK